MTDHERIKRAFGGLKAPDGLADVLLSNAESHKTPGRLRPVRRAVLVAAALLLMLSATALAVSPELREMVFGRAVEINVPAAEREFYKRNYADIYVNQEPEHKRIDALTNVHPVSGKLKSYIASHEGKPEQGAWFGPFPDDFWEQTREEIENADWLTYTHTLEFSSLDEAAAFFGIRLPQNPMLTKLTKWVTDADGNRPDVSGSMTVNREKTAAMVCLTMRFDLDDGNWADLTLHFMCDDQAAEPMKYQYYGFDSPETYIGRPSGIETLIDDRGESGDAFFVVDDVAYDLMVTCETDADAFPLLKEIVDAFE